MKGINPDDLVTIKTNDGQVQPQPVGPGVGSLEETLEETGTGPRSASLGETGSAGSAVTAGDGPRS
jgi:hypothetical protein